MNNFAAGFGDYLVPVIIVGWMIYSVVKKFSSARTEEDSDNNIPADTDSKGSIRTWLEEILLGEEFVNRTPAPNAAQTTTQQESNPAILTSASEPAPFLTNELTMYKGGERGDDKVSAPTNTPEIYCEEAANSFLADFDLRRAILYSEVLKRPYP